MHLIMYSKIETPREDEEKIVMAEPLTRANVRYGLFPQMFDPIGQLSRGTFVLIGDDTFEILNGIWFGKPYLDYVRAEWPTVQWRVDSFSGFRLHNSGVAYGVVDGNVVAILAGCTPPDDEVPT